MPNTRDMLGENASVPLASDKAHQDLLPANKTTLIAEAKTWAERATALAVTDAESCTQASFLLRSIKGVRSDIQRWFAPFVEGATETKRKAEAARKALVEEQERIEAPLVLAETTVKRHLLAWEQEQERLRLAEEQRLQAEAQAEAERRTLEAAAALEREAVATDNPAMLEEAVALLEQPTEAPAVSVKSFVPKVQGVTYRDQWKAHPTIDVKALAAAVAAGQVAVTFLQPNLVALNAFARATKGTQDVPGVRIFNDRQIAATG